MRCSLQASSLAGTSLGFSTFCCFLGEISCAGRPGERRAIWELWLGFAGTARRCAGLKIRPGLLGWQSSIGNALFFTVTLWVLPAGNWQEILVFNYDYRTLAYICLIYFFHGRPEMDLVNWRFPLNRGWSFHSPWMWSASGSFGPGKALRRPCSVT